MRSICSNIINRRKKTAAPMTLEVAVVYGLVQHLVDGNPFLSYLAEIIESIRGMSNDELRRVVVHENLVRLTHKLSNAVHVSNSGFMLGIPEYTVKLNLHTSFVLHVSVAILKGPFSVIKSLEERIVTPQQRPRSPISQQLYFLLEFMAQYF